MNGSEQAVQRSFLGAELPPALTVCLFHEAVWPERDWASGSLRCSLWRAPPTSSFRIAERLYDQASAAVVALLFVCMTSYYAVDAPFRMR